MSVIENYSNLNSLPGTIEDGVRQLQELVPANNRLAYTPEIVMEFGSASESIVNAAGEREADLIVMAARPADRTTHCRGPQYIEWSQPQPVRS
jgi:nucleotide-binding universal stress UspA family protein